MEELKVTEYRGMRVLTTQQIAEAYGVEAKKITDNFNNNKSRYVEGKHFICLDGEELKRFKSETENLGFARNLNKLYLWTKKGAFLHAKSLNTDTAWEVYDRLVDSYFDHSNLLDGMSPELKAALIVDKRVTKVEHRIDHIASTTSRTICRCSAQNRMNCRHISDAEVRNFSAARKRKHIWTMRSGRECIGIFTTSSAGNLESTMMMAR